MKKIISHAQLNDGSPAGAFTESDIWDGGDLWVSSACPCLGVPSVFCCCLKKKHD